MRLGLVIAGVNEVVCTFGCSDAIVAQCGEEGHGLPMTMWPPGFDPLAARRPSTSRCHVGFCPGLVNEHQAGGIDPLPIPGPLCTAASTSGRSCSAAISVF